MISDQYYYYRLSKENQIIYKKMYDGLLKHKEYVLCPNMSFADIDVQAIGNALHNDNPFLYYVDFGQIYFSKNALGIVKISFRYHYDKQQCQILNDKIEKYTKAIINRANIQNKTEAEIVKSLYDVLALNITYDYNALNSPIGSESFLYAHTMLGVLLKRTAVCEGISLAFKYLLNVVGINCIVVIGATTSSYTQNKNENHSWNIVKINKENYHIDLTWANVATIDSVINYDYYGLTDNDISIDHKITTVVPKCEKKDENYFYKNKLVIDSEVDLVNYAERIISNGERAIYVKLNYNTDLNSAIQIVQEKIMDNLISKGESAAIRSSSCKEQSTIVVVIMK